MKAIETHISDLLIIEPNVFGDYRGYFLESYQQEKYSKLGIDYNFVQDNFSRSQQDVLRGVHFQKNKPQGKLVSVVNGEVLDVAVDLRPDSPTFGQHEAVLLTGANHRQLFVPPGFGHGFVVLSEYADFHYKCTDFYAPEDEGGILWNDPELAINWQINEPIISEKDANLGSFSDFVKSIK